MPSVGDMAHLGRLFDQHQERLLTMLRLRIDPKLHVRLDPEEVLNDTYLEAQRRWDKGRRPPEDRSYAWLYRIALDCLIDAWRKHTRGVRNLKIEVPWPEESSLQLGLGLMDGGTGPESAMVHEEMRQRMQQALQLLKPEDREILWMRYYDGLSFAEAAVALEMTEKAAGIRHLRALRRLKALWQNLDNKE